jgi:hypothetical protein
MRRAELAVEKEEVAWDRWFNQVRPMTGVERTWREKRLAREENDTDSDDSQASPDEGGTSNEGSDSEANIQARMKPLGINMVFIIPAELKAPEMPEVGELTAGAERAVFEKPIR